MDNNDKEICDLSANEDICDLTNTSGADDDTGTSSTSSPISKMKNTDTTKGNNNTF